MKSMTNEEKTVGDVQGTLITKEKFESELNEVVKYCSENWIEVYCEYFYDECDEVKFDDIQEWLYDKMNWAIECDDALYDCIYDELSEEACNYLDEHNDDYDLDEIAYDYIKDNLYDYTTAWIKEKYYEYCEGQSLTLINI